jgi:hypothetical protein
VLCFNSGDVFSWSRNTNQLLRFEFGQKRREIAAGERPLKRLCGLLVPSLKREEPILQLAQRGEVIRSHHFVLDDRKVDFDLIEPTRVIGCVHERHRGPLRRRRAAVFSPRFVDEAEGSVLCGMMRPAIMHRTNHAVRCLRRHV